MDIPVKTMRITLRAMMESLFDAFFPEYSPNSYDYSVNEAVKALSSLCGQEKADLFRERIPVLAELLAQDVEAIGGNDPAASDTQEIVYCYPAVTAMVHYRVAHELDALGVGVIPRMLTEYAHSATGIDIHPQARIGHHFAIPSFRDRPRDGRRHRPDRRHREPRDSVPGGDRGRKELQVR